MSFKTAIALFATSFALSLVAQQSASAAHMRVVGTKFCATQKGNNIVIDTCVTGRADQNFQNKLSNGNIVTPNLLCITSSTGNNPMIPTAKKPILAIAANCKSSLKMTQYPNQFGPTIFSNIRLSTVGSVLKAGTAINFVAKDNSNSSKWEFVELSTAVVRPVTVIETVKYEQDEKFSAVLISARAGTIPNQSPKVGHSTVLLIKRFVEVNYIKFSDGTTGPVTKKSLHIYSSITTPGFDFAHPNGSVISVNHSVDSSLVAKYKAREGQARFEGYSFLEQQITSDKYYENLSVSENPRGLIRDNYLASVNCLGYNPVPDIYTARYKNTDNCNCTTASTRIFFNITGLEAGANTPTTLAESIDVFHGYESSPILDQIAIIKF